MKDAIARKVISYYNITEIQVTSHYNTSFRSTIQLITPFAFSCSTQKAPSILEQQRTSTH